MSRLKKLFSNTAIIAIGTFGSKLLVFLLMPLYTAWLTTEQFGTAEMITSLANFLIPMAAVGVSTGVFRFAADRETDREAVLSSSLALLGLGLGGFVILSPLLALIPFYRPYVWLVVLYVLFADLQAVIAQYIRAIDRTSLFAGQGILNTALTVALNVLFLYGFRMGVEGYVLSVILGNLLTCVFMIFRMRLWRTVHRSKVQRRLMWEILCFSLPMVPTTVCWLITDLSDRAMVTGFCNASAAGIYSAAYKIPTIVNLVSGIFLQAWQFSAVAEVADERDCARFYSKVYAGYLSVIMIGTAGLILLSRFLTGLLLNAAYFEAWRFMPTLLCAAALEAIVSFLASVYMVRKKSTHSFVTALVGAVLNIVMNFWLIPWIGALGAAIATLASYAAVMILRLIDAPRIIRFCVCPVRLCVSTLLLLGAAAAMTFDVPGRLWWTLGATVAVVAINSAALLRGVISILRARHGMEPEN